MEVVNSRNSTELLIPKNTNHRRSSVSNSDQSFSNTIAGGKSAAAVVNSRNSTEILSPKNWNHRRSESNSDQNIITNNVAGKSISVVNSRNSTELLSHRRSESNSDQSLISNIIAGGNSVAVVYYLSRNGNLEHPHFIEVPLSNSSHGLYLRDVMNRLNSLRGNGMPYLYSWSSKRSYKNGYVWQDLSENDLIKPTDGRDYILKGSEMIQSSISSRSSQIGNSVNNKSIDSSIKLRRRNHQSWSSFENSNDYRNNEYRVYKCESSRDLGGGKLADMATQTEEKIRRRSISFREEYDGKTVELSREELSPPPSMSSSEGIEGGCGSGDVDQCKSNMDQCGRGTMKTSRVLMQLITCGSRIRKSRNYPRT